MNFCSRDFLFHKKFDDSTLAKQHIVSHFVRSDTGHMMQAIDVTRHRRLTQQLVPPTTILSFVFCSQVACKQNMENGKYSYKHCLLIEEEITYSDFSPERNVKELLKTWALNDWCS
jgi:hypothetical protein